MKNLTMIKKSSPRSHVGKKGNAAIEGITIILFLFILGLSSMFAVQIFDGLNDEIQADEDLATVTKETSGNLFDKFPTLIDNLFLFAFILFLVFVLVSAFVIDTHPIFFIISFILLIMVFVVALFLGNAYNDVATDPTLSAYANTMPYMSWVMRHIAECIIGFGAMVSVALFAKFKLA